MDRLPGDRDLWTDTGLPAEIVEWVEREPEILNSLRHFIHPWTTHAEFLPGVQHYQRLGGRVRTEPALTGVGFDDAKAHTGSAAAMLDQLTNFGIILARNYYKGRGRPKEQLSQQEFAAGFERVNRQGHQRIESRVASLEVEPHVADSMFQDLPGALVVGAAMTLITNEQADEEGRIDFTFLDEKMKGDTKTIVQGNPVRDKYHPGYEAAMNNLRYYYDLGRDPAFFEEIVRTVAPMYALKGALSRPPDPSNPRETPMARLVREIDEACTNLTLRMEPSIPVSELERWEEEALATAGTMSQQYKTYGEQVISLYRRLLQVRTARMLTHALSIGQLRMSDVFETRTRIAAFHRVHGSPYLTFEEPDKNEVEQDTIIVVDEYLDHEVLEPATGARADTGGGERQRPEIVLDARIPELDRERVRLLVENIILPWPWPGAKLVARRLERRATPDKPIPVVIGTSASGEGGAEELQDKYYIAVLPRPVVQPDGTEVMGKSAAAEHPRISGQRHAIFVVDGRRGIDDRGRVVPEYWDLALRDKGTAWRLGAERVLHIGDPYGRVREKLLGPLRPLRHGRVMGTLATETTMDGTDDQV
jgi:hypothetical protein